MSLQKHDIPRTQAAALMVGDSLVVRFEVAAQLERELAQCREQFADALKIRALGAECFGDQKDAKRLRAIAAHLLDFKTRLNLSEL